MESPPHSRYQKILSMTHNWTSATHSWHQQLAVTGFLFLILCSPGGRQAAAQLRYPIDVAVHEDSIYVVDRTLPGVQKISPDGQLSVVFEASKKFRTPLNGARSIVVAPDGGLIVGDSATRQLYRLTGDQPEAILTSKTGIGVPYAMAYDQQGNLFVADLEPPGRIYRVPVGKTEPEVFAVQPGVRGLTIDAEGNLITVTGLAEALLKFSPMGKRTVILGNRPFRFPNAVVAKGSDLFVSDSYGKCIWKINSAGEASKFCESGLTYPGGMTVHGDNLLVTDAKVGKIMSISPDGMASEVQVK